VLLHWFLKAEDISTIKGYEKADMYVHILVCTNNIYCVIMLTDILEPLVVWNVSNPTGKTYSHVN
jgi:hypothetical protein